MILHLVAERCCFILCIGTALTRNLNVRMNGMRTREWSKENLD